ncbi:MAG TPA: hypothetical protein VIF15_17090 [Polyangiaceae bacterium]|jgi:hypothetical protein
MSLRAAPPLWLAWPASLGLALAATGCHGCRDDHPYVPYAIGSPEAGPDASDEAAPSASAPTAGDAGGSFEGEAAITAPPGLARWPVEGVVLEAPSGLVFVAAVVQDLDGDGKKDAFALVRPVEGNDPGELAWYRGQPGGDVEAGALAEPVTFAPPALARDSGCTPVDRLVLVGRHAVMAELGAQCAAHATGVPDRWMAVVAAGTVARVRLAVTIADPPGAPALTLDADAADRDGDGRPDLALRITLEGGSAPLEPGPRVSATLAWLDRPAGLSRDAGATESSFALLAATAGARARNAKDAAAVPGLVAQARALFGAVCVEGGAPRLTGVVGTGAIACGAARPLEDAGLAEVHAYVTSGDALRASLALDRAERPPAARTPARLTEARGWIAALAPVANVRAVRAVAGVPELSHGHGPAWGALAFEASGKLLVLTRAGVVRVDPDAGDENAAPDVPAWRAAVVSPEGTMRWIETYDPCDGVALRGTFASGDDMRDVALPVAPALGDHCAGSRGSPARAVPVAWGPGGLEAIVEGQPLLVAADLAHATPLAAFLDSPVLLGSPRSPDGKTLVVATAAGLLVRGPSRARLLRAPELEGAYSDQRDCTVSNDGTHVACVRGSKAWVGAWDAP